MGADDWLHAIVKKLDIAPCNSHEMVMFASHQLMVLSSERWDKFSISHANVQAITWHEFVQDFRMAHIPFGVIAQKKKEFRTLSQGSRFVTEYLHKFNQLARYTPEDVATDETK